MTDGVTGTDAGVVAVGVAAGGSVWAGIRWLFTWTDRRAIRRDAKLQAWEDSLDRREREQHVLLESRLAAMAEALNAMRAALIESTHALRRLDPENAALAKAEAALRAAYPVDFATPFDLTALTAKLDVKG